MREKKLRTEQIRAKLAEIEESVALVEENLPDSFEEFSKLGLVKDGIYKRIEFAIENVYDICAIINSDLKVDMPESDEGILDNLEHKGILTEEMKDNIRRMKGFRNIMVHRYGTIDDSITYSILVNNINDFYKFVELIENYLEKNCPKL
jgi:uncharacterized protein YutE (UPF0331/DUF86 family)